ncbi:MAG: cytochrome b/b6 domain-containing protein [Alphaproteobacteria bacterium]|nr:cytochrome b/b6 domain-containing protein [Alphaproteobacteria bacterium]
MSDSATYHQANQVADAPRHAIATRILHALLATAIIVQLASSQFMNPDDGGDNIFGVHAYVGLAAFALVLGFWVQSLMRQRGTPLGMLIPWFSGARLAAVWTDFKAHLSALTHLRLPTHDTHSPFAAAIHGLGQLLVTAMAASGTLYYFVNTGDPDAGGLVKVAMTVHTTLANLVWAYLIGHALMALIAHYGGTLSLRQMWSLRRRPELH